MNLLSVGLLVALIGIGASALVFSLNEPPPQPIANARINTNQLYPSRDYRPAPCPTPSPDPSARASIDPGILAPGWQAAPGSHAGKTALCYRSVPAQRPN